LKYGSLYLSASWSDYSSWRIGNVGLGHVGTHDRIGRDHNVIANRDGSHNNRARADSNPASQPRDAIVMGANCNVVVDKEIRADLAGEDIGVLSVLDEEPRPDQRTVDVQFTRPPEPIGRVVPEPGPAVQAIVKQAPELGKNNEELVEL